MGIFPVMIQASSRPLGTCAIETESGSQEMTSDEEIQKQIRELEAPLRRRAERLRFIFKMTNISIIFFTNTFFLWEDENFM